MEGVVGGSINENGVENDVGKTVKLQHIWNGSRYSGETLNHNTAKLRRKLSASVVSLEQERSTSDRFIEQNCCWARHINRKSWRISGIPEETTREAL